MQPVVLGSKSFTSGAVYALPNVMLSSLPARQKTSHSSCPINSNPLFVNSFPHNMLTGNFMKVQVEIMAV